MRTSGRSPLKFQQTSYLSIVYIFHWFAPQHCNIWMTLLIQGLTVMQATNLNISGNTTAAHMKIILWPDSSSGPRPPNSRGFMITLRHNTLGWTPLDEWSACRTDVYLTTHHSEERETSMPLAGFEPAIPASDRPQTHALDRTVIAIGVHSKILQ
jgi:hypothetical protein